MSARLVLGLDVGGTSTRALAVDAATGARLGAGSAQGANPVAHGVPRAAENIGAALAQALAGHDPAEVRACVVGMAGASKLAADPQTAAAFAELWQKVGLRCEVSIVSDVAAAFAAGTAEPDGSVLVAGTGAVAAAMAGRVPRRWRDGHGWLLGDEGSGFWIGRQAVRATLVAVEGWEPMTILAKTVLATCFGRQEPLPEPAADPDRGRSLASALIAAVNARPPVDLAVYAACVLACVPLGDPTALRIVTEAAGHLVSALGHVRGPGESSPIVLAGGVLRPGMRLERPVRESLAATWPEAPIHAATDGAAGAAWLAALPLFGDDPDAARTLHARLITEGGSGHARTRRG